MGLPSAALPRRSLPGGRADEIRAKAEVTARMSVVEFRPGLPRTWLELRFLATKRDIRASFGRYRNPPVPTVL
jgi:hypothetical protein